MNSLNKILLFLCFTFALGCGETTSGSSQAEPASTPPAPARESGAQRAEPGSNEPLPAKTNSAENDKPSSLSSLSAVDYVEGTHYERLPKPVPTIDKNRIEVTEVFWYGCSHCYDFEAYITPWAANLAEDVVLVKNPAMWDNQGIMENHARIYYTAKVLGVEEKISPLAFRALNVEQKPLRTDAEISKLFTDSGVSAEDFERTFKSFGVTSSVRQAEARQRSYRVQGTPEVIVDGTYRITGRMAGSHQAMLKIADHLVAKIRKEKSAS